MTLGEFATRFALSRPTIYRLVERGALRLVKIGRASRIRREDAEAWAARLPSVGRAA
jgi:excisionase family DNA binding protein